MLDVTHAITTNCKGVLPDKKFGNARRKIQIKPLKKTYLGVVQE